MSIFLDNKTLIDEDIELFISSFFSEEMSTLLIRGLCVLMDAENEFDVLDLNTLIFDDEKDPHSKRDNFIEIISNRLIKILDHYGIKLYENELKYVVPIVEGLQSLLHLEEYESVLSVLENDITASDKFAGIMELTTCHNIDFILSITDEVSESSMNTLMIYCLNHNAEEDDSDNTNKYVDDMKVLRNMYKERIPLGLTLFDSGVPTGIDIHSIISMLNDYLSAVPTTPVELVAADVYTLLVLCKGNNYDINKCWNEIKEVFYEDEKTQDDVYKLMLNMPNEYKRTLEVMNGQNRISE